MSSFCTLMRNQDDPLKRMEVRGHTYVHLEKRLYATAYMCPASTRSRSYQWAQIICHANLAYGPRSIRDR